MEVNEIQCKFPRMRNGKGRSDSSRIDSHGQFPDEEEEGEQKREDNGGGGGGGVAAKMSAAFGGGVARLYGWPSSRIVRVSRASGGKDRHSKVLTSKGLRDRRVRLSVNTAIQFYDLQDRLGFDQPSKAVEWLLKAAASSIDELPPMNASFLDSPNNKQLSEEKMSSPGGGAGGGGGGGYGSDQLALDSVDMDQSYTIHQQQIVPVPAPVTKSSSNSENSKGSGLSLSRSEHRVKARVRAKERAAEKDKDSNSISEPSAIVVANSLNPVSHTTSFTELLNSNRQWSSTPMEYFSTGQTNTVSNHQPLFSVAVGGDHNHFSFLPNENSNNEYNLNFTIASSGNSGFNRGTLQSNSSTSSMLPHLQRFPNLDGSPQNFFINTTSPPPTETNHHHQFLSGFDGRLHFSYGDSAHRGGKGKN